MIDIIDRTCRIIYPGYFSDVGLDAVNMPYFLGQEIVKLFDILSQQITFAIRHDCRRFNQPCTNCEERGQRAAMNLLGDIPDLQALLAKDVLAAFEGDPASKNFDEIIFSYPGLFAVTVYRIAHHLHEQGVPLMPRIMTEYAHAHTGIDIHPGVHIGETFFIDHGTGVVVGETTVIGNNVRLYQGVTLGALSLGKDECEQLRGQKRHPTIEDDVIIYANATILKSEPPFTEAFRRMRIGWAVEAFHLDPGVELVDKADEFAFMHVLADKLAEAAPQSGRLGGAIRNCDDHLVVFLFYLVSDEYGPGKIP